VEYRAHTISVLGVEMDPSKIQAAFGWPLKDVTEVWGFLGLTTGYFRRFIKDYGKTALTLAFID